MAPAKVLTIAGYGPGISAAVATLWASNGFAIALLSRTQAKLDAAVEEFKSKGIKAVGYATDLADPKQVKDALSKVEAELGPTTVLLYNPAATAWGDVLSLPIEAVASNVQGAVTGLIAAVQAVVPKQEGQPGAAILVTGGGLSLAAENPHIAKVSGAMGGIVVGATKAAQRNLVYTLAEVLAPKGIRVAEVVVTNLVKAPGNDGQIRPEDVAADFWELYEQPVGGLVSTVRETGA